MVLPPQILSKLSNANDYWTNRWRNCFNVLSNPVLMDTNETFMHHIHKVPAKLLCCWLNYSHYITCLATYSTLTLLFRVQAQPLENSLLISWQEQVTKVTNRFHDAVHLFSNLSQMMSKCGIKEHRSGTWGDSWVCHCVSHVHAARWWETDLVRDKPQ